MNRGPAADVSGSVRFITTFIFILLFGFSVFSIESGEIGPVFGSILLIIVLAYGYLRQPQEYSIENGALIVRYRMGEHAFDGVQGIEKAGERFSFGIRTWGNGGVFAYTGLFRNRTLGSYRAYVTDPKSCLIVKTASKPIVISPENFEHWHID